MKIFLTSIFFAIILFLFSCNNIENRKELVNDGETSILEHHITSIINIKDSDSLSTMAMIYDEELQQILSDSALGEFRKEVGMISYRHSQFELAEDYFILSENSFNRAHLPLKATQMLANQAVLQELKGNYKEAVTIYISTAEFFKQHNDSTSWASALSNIGVVYEEMGLAKKAIYYDKLSLSIKLAMHNTLGAATNYNNIGVAFFELLNMPDSAIIYYNKAFNIYKEEGGSVRCAMTRDNLAMLYVMLNNYSMAEHHLQKAERIFDSVGNLQGKAITLRYFGELHFAKGNDQKSLEYFNSAMQIFKQINDKKSLMEMGTLLSKVYISLGRYAEATQMMQFRNALKDSLMNNENQAIIAEMESKYQLKEKNKTIEVLQLEEELQQRRVKNLAVIIVSLLIIITLTIIILYFNISKNKLNQKQLRLELQNYLLRIGELQVEVSEKGDCGKFSEEKLMQYDLSEREIEVLNFIAQGYKNSEIAEKLFVSRNTIKTHIKNIYIKLDVKNRVEALKRVDIV